MNAVIAGGLLAQTFVTLVVIMDPVGTIPIFLALTSGHSIRLRRRAAWQAVSVSLVVIVLFAVFGRTLLTYLNISIPALQGAGGLLLLLVALQLLTGQENDPVETRNVNVALVPLGTPLLAGPGAIVAVMVFVGRVHHVADATAIALGIVGVHVLLWLAMRYSLVILRVIRDAGVTLLTRISGLLLSAIAVQLVADSVRAFAAGRG